MKSNRIELARLLFYIAYSTKLLIGILSITVLHDTTIGNTIHHIGWYVSLLIAMVSIVCQIQHSQRIVLISVFFVFLFVLSSVYSRTTTLIALFIFIYAAKNVSLKKTMMLFVCIHAITAIVCVFGSKIGIIENIQWIQGDRIRNSLGYKYATYLSKVFFFIVLSYVFLRNRNFRLIELVCIEIINYLIYRETDSRTTFYLLAVFSILCYVAKYIKPRVIHKKKRRYLYIYVYVICAIVSFSIVLGYMYSNATIFQTINDKLSGRLYISAYDIREYGISPFGKQVEWVGQVAKSLDPTLTITFIDCSYLNILMEHGYVVFVLVMIMTVIVMQYIVSTDNLIFVLLHIMNAIHFMIEPQLIDLTYSVLPLFFMNSLYFIIKQKTINTDYELLQTIFPNKLIGKDII